VETPQDIGPDARALLEQLRAEAPEPDNSDVPVEERGLDLTCEVRLSVASAALGGEVIIGPGGGQHLRLRYPAGTQNGQIFRLRGRGKDGGDLYVTMHTVMPSALTEKARDILRELQALGGGLKNVESDSFIERVRGFFERSGS
jgi:molecular chaperone DnaJ